VRLAISKQRVEPTCYERAGIRNRMSRRRSRALPFASA
jgi:hypothetical protein